ncbi:hypothetical protein JW752_02865 [Candidatus Peregrinibacteria bacterium]|nr:hypothetical protein [Candidatus Peregrinibacteria bacterium]
MSFFKNFDWSFKSIAKVIGLVLLGIVVLSIIISLISFSFRTVFQTAQYGYNEGYVEYGKGGGAMYDMAAEPMMARSGIVPVPNYSTGPDAEDYEVKTYSATIKTRKLEQTCGVVSALKTREDVIFENANQNDDNCYFSFKVKKESTNAVLKVIEGLNPEDINENISTIKGTIEYYDKQLEILEKKLESVEDTLSKAQSAYDEVADLATRKQDVESLALIISNKLELIEKLTNERLSIKEQIDRYNQNKADQMERLNYSFFTVNIYKDLIFDWKNIKDSWKYELKAFVTNFNEVIQGISVHLVTYFVRFIQVAIYFFISVFLLKYAWVATKRIWKGKGKKR